AGPSSLPGALPAEPVWLWGVPLAPFTFQQALERIERLMAQGQPSYIVTANLHTLMLANQDGAFHEAVLGAAFTLADGMPLVWATRWRELRLPERVAGSDLTPAVCALAAARGYRIFLLGGAPGAAEEAARELQRRYPGIQIAGTEAPPFHTPSTEEEAVL